ncbi:MAG: zinc-ribbon domain-containing protein [Myxococcota bacterium]
MIVTCERCSTQFQLDDARIPETGVRVRCSRCKHAFEIRRPAPAAPPAPSTEDEESDWQFAEDPPPEEDAGSGDSAASVVDDLLAGADGPPGPDPVAAPSGLELSDDPPGEPAPAPEPAQAPAPEPAAATAAREPDPPPAPEAAPVLPADPTPSGLDLAGEPEPAPAPVPEPAPAPGPDPVGQMASELASELEPEAPAGSAAPLEAAPAAADAPAEPDPDELAPGDWDLLAGSDGDLGAGPARSVEVDPDELVDDRPRWQAGLESVGQMAGGLAVVLLVGLTLRTGVVPEPDVAAAPTIRSEAGLEVEDVEGRFVDHSAAGPVYVVSGRLRNAGGATIPPGSLGVSVLDADGRPLAAPVRVGPPLSTQAVREGQIEGPGRRSPGLRAGESRSFQAVVAPLPEGAERFDLVRLETAPVPSDDAAPQPPGGAAAGSELAAGAPDAPPGTAPDGPEAPSAPPAAPVR